MVRHSGGCHCGRYPTFGSVISIIPARVRWVVDGPAELVVQDCNCSICMSYAEAVLYYHLTYSICFVGTKKGILHLIVPKQSFRLLTDWNELALYTFNTRVAKHYFCKTCGRRLFHSRHVCSLIFAGIGSFYIPRSNPDGIDINARCIDSDTVKKMTIEPFVRVTLCRLETEACVGRKTVGEECSLFGTPLKSDRRESESSALIWHDRVTRERSAWCWPPGLTVVRGAGFSSPEEC